MNKTPVTTNAVLMKPDEAAPLAGVSVRTITRMCSKNPPFGCCRFGSSWRINRADFLRYIGAAE